ncbi:MAG: tRNA 2-selenouridine(34) synthase MnmH, partial [Pseudomonadota bacterium]
MSLAHISAAEALLRLGDFSNVIDARSEGEYAEDHLPGAINWPSLNDEERKIVGTHYKQISAFEARKLGASMVAKNIAEHIRREVLDKPREWQPLVYCWRGGKRSGSLALILDQIGFNVTVIEGGYKAFRAALVADLPQLAARYSYRVICGTTGSGKTRLLQALHAQGAQVLDLEALARHRSSVLGMIPGQAQPTQKAFDRLIWATLRGFDPSRPVYIESESKKVGNVAIPEGLVTAMRSAPCLQLDLPEDERVALLLEDYDFFVRDIEFFCERLEALVQARGKETVKDWQARSRSGDVASVVRELLVKHYDPVYLQSIKRNFDLYPQATVL